MENKRKHLELIQGLITRMASNSFLLKGWTVTIVSAIFVLAQKDSNILFILVSVFPIFFFWILDGFFLRQERLFRRLYEHVRQLEENQIDFSMDTSHYQGEIKNLFRTTLSKTLCIFYVGILGADLVAALVTFFIKH
jgi:hypothetical protein